MDRAYTHLTVEYALRFEAFDGAFSHAGFRHPGPIFYYYLAGARTVLDGILPAKGIYHLATLFLNCLFLTAALYLSFDTIRAFGSRSDDYRCGPLVLLLFALTLALVGSSPGAMLLDYWNPYPIPAAALFYVIALARFSVGKVALLPIIAAAGSFIAQCHVGTPPFLVLTFLYACLALFFNRAVVPVQLFVRSLIWAALLLVLFWAPVLIDIYVNGSESNPARIAAEFQQEHKTRHLRQPFWFLWRLVVSRFQVLADGSAEWGRLFPVLMLGGLVLVVVRKRGELRHLAVMLMLAWAVTIWALSRSFQPFAEYLISYFNAVIILAAWIMLVWSVRLVAGGVSRKIGSDHVNSSLLAIVLACFIAMRAFPGLVNTAARGGCQQRDFAARYADKLPFTPGHRYRIEPQIFELRSFVVFLALELTERGVPFCFNDAWGHYVGRALTCGYQRQRAAQVREVGITLRFADGSQGNASAPKKRRRSSGAELGRRAIMMEEEQGGVILQNGVFAADLPAGDI